MTYTVPMLAFSLLMTLILIGMGWGVSLLICIVNEYRPGDGELTKHAWVGMAIMLALASVLTVGWANNYQDVRVVNDDLQKECTRLKQYEVLCVLEGIATGTPNYTNVSVILPAERAP